MTNLKHGPKIRALTTTETIASLECWKNNIIYGLRQNPDFREFLTDGFIWGKKSRTSPYRDLRDLIGTERNELWDVEDDSVIIKSREDRAYDLDMMLDQISNYAPHIPRNDITKDSSCLDEVFQKIRMFYNLQRSGALQNECWNIRRQPEETPQALFARLKQSYDDCLLTRNSLWHVDGQLQEDEEMSPTLLNDIILHWLNILHPQMRDAVTQRFATQLRDSTYATILPEISRSVDSLLQEITSGSLVNRMSNLSLPSDHLNQAASLQSPHAEEASINRLFPYKSSQPRLPLRAKSNNRPSYQRTGQKKICDYCRIMGRRAYNTHSIDECLFMKRE